MSLIETCFCSRLYGISLGLNSLPGSCAYRVSDASLYVLNSFFQVLAAIGGIFTLFGGSGFWAFTFWSTVVISGLLLGLAVFQILPTLEAKIPLLSKAVCIFLLNPFGLGRGREYFNPL